MCGIYGVVGAPPGSGERMARGAIAALQHRGPDAHGIWSEGDVALGHARLKVIDLSEAAAQPMAGCDARVQLTFNGEIYNHHALRADLEGRGHRFRSRSDSEVIVHGFEEWGPGVVERLDGMFAFGLWDGRSRTLLLARDRTGKKPLFYTDPEAASSLSGGAPRFAFASEIKALTAAARAGRDALAAQADATDGTSALLGDTLDPAALPMLLAFGYVPAPATLHRGVRSLPPAGRLVDRAGRAALDEYWRPTFLERPLEVSADEAAARVRELTIAAVQRRLEADVPLGAFLSGGLDSTIVVGILARHFGRRVKTFSIGFSGDDAYDETAFARQASRAFGTDHTEFVVEPGSLGNIEHLVWLHDGPFGDSSAVPTHTVARLTREHVTVALTGDGGDELFAGYLRLLAAEAAERIPRLLRSSMERAAGLLPRALPEKSLGARARRFLGKAALPMADRVAGWGSFFAGELPSILHPDVARHLDVDGPADWQREFFDGASDWGRPSPLARLLDHNFRAYLAYDLQTKVDRSTAGVGLEARSPFLDTALCEYAGRLPDHLRRRGTTTKWILRRAFADLVPASILTRGKMGFGMPLATWFRGPLREALHDRLARGARVDTLLQRSTIDQLLARHAAGEDLSARLWLLLTLEVWLRSLEATTTTSSCLHTAPAA